MRYQFQTTVVEALVGDLTDQDVDAIVNAANRQLVGGGGVDGAVHARGGPAIMQELDRIRAEQGGCPTGQAVITTGGQLKARYVIHAVGPIYHGRTADAELLATCYSNSLALATARNLASVAFASISTGVYGYPIAQAAPIAVNTVLANLGRCNFREIRFVLFSRHDYQVYQAILETRKDLKVIDRD